MRKFAYNEPGQDAPVVLTEDDIKRTYWPYWVEQMEAARARGQRNALNAEMSWENCLDDFLTIHWAWEVEDDQAG